MVSRVKHRPITPRPYLSAHETGICTLEPHLTAAVELDSDPDTAEEAVERWEPDALMVSVVLSSPKASRGLKELSGPDRSWLVAGLTLAGMSAKEIAARTDCSIRLVKAIRAEPMTQVCAFVHEEIGKVAAVARAEKALRLATESDLEQSRLREARIQRQLDQVLGKLAAGALEAFPRCGHPKVEWNVYVHRGVDSQGQPFSREYCRECNNARATQYRARRKSAGEMAQSHQRVMILHASSIASAV